MMHTSIIYTVSKSNKMTISGKKLNITQLDATMDILRNDLSDKGSFIIFVPGSGKISLRLEGYK